jgi:hypothetical protein
LGTEGSFFSGDFVHLLTIFVSLDDNSAHILIVHPAVLESR